MEFLAIIPALIFFSILFYYVEKLDEKSTIKTINSLRNKNNRNYLNSFAEHHLIKST